MLTSLGMLENMAALLVCQAEEAGGIDRLRRIAAGRMRIASTGYEPDHVAEAVRQAAQQRLDEIASNPPPKRPGFWRSLRAFIRHRRG